MDRVLVLMSLVTDGQNDCEGKKGPMAIKVSPRFPRPILGIQASTRSYAETFELYRTDSQRNKAVAKMNHQYLFFLGLRPCAPSARRSTAEHRPISHTQI